ncbi:MAG: hypothetical protein ACREJC_05780, partial [Tepidisphaeraceae bacterium]
MALQSVTTSTTQHDKLPIASSALENLAARFRPGGAMLLLLGTDGRVLYADAACGAFFQRYVTPMLAGGETAPGVLTSVLSGINPNSGVCVWDVVPGVSIAGFPYVDKRSVRCILALAARHSSFKLSEDVVRVCGRLGLDGIWLNQQADELPAYSSDAILRHARLLLTMVRDQVRVSSLEKEIDTLSVQLSNTYEELSLIYQISGGMKVNRGAGDFFKQACLDVLEVMGVRGIGAALRGESFQGLEPALYGAMTLP